jgi:hypothetical protein
VGGHRKVLPYKSDNWTVQEAFSPNIYFYIVAHRSSKMSSVNVNEHVSFHSVSSPTEGVT